MQVTTTTTNTTDLFATLAVMDGVRDPATPLQAAMAYELAHSSRYMDFNGDAPVAAIMRPNSFSGMLATAMVDTLDAPVTLVMLVVELALLFGPRVALALILAFNSDICRCGCVLGCEHLKTVNSHCVTPTGTRASLLSMKRLKTSFWRPWTISACKL